MGFTFYGDLLGISGYYKLNSTVAREKLNDFYNTTFYSLSDYCRENPASQVIMFSDSLLFFGDDALSALEQLHLVYVKLLHKGLLLRGAIVDGKLQFEPRLTLENYQKMLPNDDTLAKAVGMESTKKGARLLVENTLASQLLDAYPEWRTLEGYIRNVSNGIYSRIPYEHILRRISPTPEQDTYECLYFWVCHRHLGHNDVDYRVKVEDLEEIKSMLGDSIAVHYKETIDLLKRCNRRQKLTKEKMGIYDGV